MVNWKVTAADFDALAAISRRAHADCSLDQREVLMDLNAVHANGNPLDLISMLAGSAGDFAHDIFGIRRYLDRTTGKLTDFFTPRFSAKSDSVCHGGNPAANGVCDVPGCICLGEEVKQ